MDICPKCGLPDQACVCNELAKAQQQIEIKLDRRRFGKFSTLISGFDNGVDVKAIAKVLKAKRACGGTVKNKTIELQGNHKGNITKILSDLGFKKEKIKK